MRVGFVHGVMNTDNMSILGLTIDYGPYGWIDNFDPEWTPNTTDAQGRRYRYGHQPQIVHWNLTRLAEALVPLFPTRDPLLAGLEQFAATYSETYGAMLAAKFGLRRLEQGDDDLLAEILALMQRAEVDMTAFFRGLAEVDVGSPAVDALRPAFYREALRERHEPELAAWIEKYAARARRDGLAAEDRRRAMNATNPRYVLRNYLAQEAIDLAEQGDGRRVSELLEVMRRPYEEQPGRERYAALRPDWARHKAGCSMLSCSS
jgi:uncharacterized protein YdiU (UPF0061 family)